MRTGVGAGIGISSTRQRVVGEQPISSIKTTSAFYNEIRLESGYTDTQNVEPLTNFADSSKPNASQGTPSKIPAFVADDLNGHPSILLDGVDDFYNLGNTYEDVFRGDFGFVMVVKVLDGQNGQQTFLGTAIDSLANTVEILHFADGKLYFRLNADGQQISLISDNVLFSAGENPWMILSGFLSFSTNSGYLRLNGAYIPFTNSNDDISTVDPTLYSNSRNPFLFAENAGNARGFNNCRTVAPPILLQSLSDVKNAETELNSKYEIY